MQPTRSRYPQEQTFRAGLGNTSFQPVAGIRDADALTSGLAALEPIC